MQLTWNYIADIVYMIPGKERKTVNFKLACSWNKKEVMFTGGDCRIRLTTYSTICEIVSFRSFSAHFLSTGIWFALKCIIQHATQAYVKFEADLFHCGF